MKKKKIKRYIIYVTLAIMAVAMIISQSASAKKKHRISSELQASIKYEKIEKPVIFGDRNQYVTMNHITEDYWNSEDVKAKFMSGKNIAGTVYDEINELGEVYVTVFDFRNDFKKEVVNLTPFFKKVENYKYLYDLAAKIETVDGRDYLLMTATYSRPSEESKEYHYIYDFDNHKFFSNDSGITSFDYYTEDRGRIKEDFIANTNTKITFPRYYSEYDTLNDITPNELTGKDREVALSRYLTIERSGKKAEFPPPPKAPKKPVMTTHVNPIYLMDPLPHRFGEKIKAMFTIDQQTLPARYTIYRGKVFLAKRSYQKQMKVYNQAYSHYQKQLSEYKKYKKSSYDQQMMIGN